MNFIILQLIAFIAAISISLYYLKKDNLKLLAILIVFSTLGHKEYFGLIVSDFLPIRSIYIAIALYMLYVFIQYAKSTSIDKTRKLALIEMNDYFKDLRRNNFTLVVLLIFTILSFLSIPFSTYASYSASLAIYWLSIVVLYLVCKYLFELDKKRFINIFLTTTIYTAVGMSLFTFLQIALRYPKIKEVLGTGIKIGAIYTDINILPRVGALFWDVNHYGAFLILPIFLLIGKFFYFKELKKQLYWLTLLSITTLSLILTQSRSALLGLGVGLIVLLIVLYFKKFTYAFKIIGLVAFIIFMFAFSAINYFDYSFTYLIETYGHLRLDSFNTHLKLVKGSANIMSNHPFAGVGTGNFTAGYTETSFAEQQFKIEPNLIGQRIPTHTFWGEIISENGIIGLITYGLFFTYIVLGLIIVLNKYSYKKDFLLPATLLSVFVGINVSAIFYSYKLEFFWLTIFLIVFYLQKEFDQRSVLNSIIDYYKNNYNYLAISLVTFFSALLIFIGLGANTLIDFDEAIYAKVAKNMYNTGEYFSLRWENLQEYWFEKPPLIFILMAGSFKLFGLNEFAARLPSAIMGFITLIFTYKLAKKYFNTTVAIVSSFVLLSTTHFILYARKSMIDTAMSFVTITVIYFMDDILYKNTEKRDKKYYLMISLVVILIAMGILFKSIIGFLPLVILFLQQFLKNNNNLLPRLIKFTMICFSGALLASSWYLYSYITHGDQFIKVHIIEHILNRANSGLGHEEAWNFYILTIRTTLRIWFIPLLLLPILYFSKFDRINVLKILIAFLSIITIFSISSDKLQWYIVPIYPYAAILVGLVMYTCYEIVVKYLKLTDQTSRALNLGLILLTVTVAIFYINFSKERFYPPDTNRGRKAIALKLNERFPLQEDNANNDDIYIIDTARHLFYFYMNNNPVEINLNRYNEKVANTGVFDYKVAIAKESHYLKLINNLEQFEDKYYELDLIDIEGDWVLIKSVPKIDQWSKQVSLINRELDAYYKLIDNNIALSDQSENILRELEAERLELTRLIFDYNNGILIE